MTDLTANAQQAEYWNDAGHKWVDLQSFLDDQLRQLGLDAMDGLGAIEGAAVLDVGCGCGNTSLELGRRVGLSGSVLGIDLSAPMLARARQSADDLGYEHVTFARVDAQTYATDRNFDAVYSRFGVMFFSDPQAAFANIRTLMKNRAKMSFVCWRAITDNPVDVRTRSSGTPAPSPTRPAETLKLRDRSPSPTGRGCVASSKGPGSRRPKSPVTTRTMTVGAGRSLDEVVRLVMQMGPTGRLLQGASEATKTNVATSVRDALAAHDGPHGIQLGASSWLVSARNG